MYFEVRPLYDYYLFVYFQILVYISLSIFFVISHATTGEDAIYKLNKPVVYTIKIENQVKSPQID